MQHKQMPNFRLECSCQTCQPAVLKQLCVLGSFRTMITVWTWRKEKEEESSECIQQVFWLGGYKSDSNNVLSTCWGPPKIIINRIYFNILHGKEEHPWCVTETVIIIFSYKIFLQPRWKDYCWGIFRLNATYIA